MKLPRYLQVSLLLTGGLLLYSLLENTPDPVATPTLAVVRHSPVVSAAVSPPASTPFVDLFPSEIKPPRRLPDAKPRALTVTPERAATPPLPFRLVGAWWSGSQRTLMLQQADRHWVICRRCRVPGHLWVGMKLTADWQLKSVSAQRLTFLWLPQMREQSMALGAMSAEPIFPGLKKIPHAK